MYQQCYRSLLIKTLSLPTIKYWSSPILKYITIAMNNKGRPNIKAIMSRAYK